jgi:hypothetical protein
MSSQPTMASRFRMVSPLYASVRSRWGNICLAGDLSPFPSRCSLVAARKCGRQERLAEESFGLYFARRPIPCRDRIDVSVDGDIDNFVLRDVGLPPADDVAVVILADYHSLLLSADFGHRKRDNAMEDRGFGTSREALARRQRTPSLFQS